MGQAIYYCFNCSKQLREVQFDQGKAFRLGEKVCCEACAPESVKKSARAKKISSPSIQTPKPMRSSQISIAPAKSSSKLPLIGAALGGAGLVLLLIVVFSGGSPPAPPPEPPPVAAPTKKAPAVAKPPAADVDPLAEAKRYAAEHPDDLEGQIKRYQDLAFGLGDKPAGVEARKEIDALRAREKQAVDRDLATLRAEIEPLVKTENFDDALRALETATHRQRGAQWKLAVAKLSEDVAEGAAKLLPPIRDKAAEAKAKGKLSELDVLLKRVDAWGLPRLKNELAKALEAVEPPPPPPPPTSADAKLYAASWEKAAATRDYAAAAAALEKLALSETAVAEERAKDVASLKELAKLYPEMLASIVNGKPAFLSLGGNSGRVMSIDLERVELQFDPKKPTVFHEWAELPLSTLLTLAKRSGVSAELVARLDERLPKPAPDATREAFYQAERDYRDPATRAKSFDAYAKLLSSPYAKRAKERIESAREYAFVPPGLASGGGFAPTKDGKLATSADGDAWAEVEFYAAAGTPYRCWALLGACCGEADVFYYQATGHTETDPKTKKKASAEPGGPLASQLKASIRGLKSAHPAKEPKTPSKWDWVEVPLPKFAEAGAKKIRLIADKAGAGVAGVVVSATLKKAPTDVEWQELAKKSEGTSSTSTPVVTLDDFEADKMSWGYVGGQEFPGSKGDLAVDSALFHDGKRSIRLKSDFTGGGAYVGTWRVWAPPAGWDVRELRIWMKSEGVSRIGLRIVDGSDQCHQKTGGLAIQATTEWQEVVLKISDMVGGQHWGGANDAKWHPGFRGFGINIGNDGTPPDTKKGTLWIDDVRAVLEPIP